MLRLYNACFSQKGNALNAMVGRGPREHGALSLRINAFFAGPFESMLPTLLRHLGLWLLMHVHTFECPQLNETSCHANTLRLAWFSFIGVPLQGLQNFLNLSRPESGESLDFANCHHPQVALTPRTCVNTPLASHHTLTCHCIGGFLLARLQMPNFA